MSLSYRVIKLLILIALSLLWVSNSRALDLYVSVTGCSTWNGTCTVESGTEITMAMTAANNNGDISYCWDFMTKATSGTKWATWNHSLLMPCQSTLEDPAITYDFCGEHLVQVAVTDDDGTKRLNFIVDVTCSDHVLNAIDDCSLVADGATDNSSALESCLDYNDLADKVTLNFPAGQYRFTALTDITHADGKTHILIKPLTNYGTVTIIFDPPSGSGIGWVSSVGGLVMTVQDLILKYDLDGNDQSDEPTSYPAGGTAKLYYNRLRVQDFHNLSNNSGGLIDKVSLLDYGHGDDWDERISALSGAGAGNAPLVIRRLYASTDRKTEHFIYYSSGINGDGAYVLDTWIRHTDVRSSGKGVQYIYDETYLWNNYFDGDDVGPGMVWTAYVEDAEIIDNTWVNFGDSVFGAIFGTATINAITVQYNNINDSAVRLAGLNGPGYDLANLTFSDNNSGSGATSPYYDFKPTGDCSACDGDESTLNPAGCGCATFSNNTDDSTDHSKTDPGEWDLIPPNLCYVGISGNTVMIDASDADLGTTARWNLFDGAQVQCLFSDNTLSFLQDYSTSFTCTPNGEATVSSVYVWDNDHNRSVSRAAGEHCGRTVRGSSITGIIQ